MRDSETSQEQERQYLRLFSDSKSNYRNTQNPLQGLGGPSSPVADLAHLVGRDKDFIAYTGDRDPDNGEGDDRKRLVPVSLGIAQYVIDSVKRDLYRQYRLFGRQDDEQDDESGQIKIYLRTVAPEDRPAVAWTLNQIYFNVVDAVNQAIMAKDPTWKPGRPVDPRSLDEIFTEENLKDKFTEGIEIITRLDFKV